VRVFAQSSPLNGDDGENVEKILAARVRGVDSGCAARSLRKQLQLVDQWVDTRRQPGIVSYPDVQPQSGFWTYWFRRELDQ
jgi:hypothetical protein